MRIATRWNAAAPCILATLALVAAPPADAGSYIFTTFDPPGATGSNAIGINNLGQIVGDYFDPNRHGFLSTGGVFSTIDVPGAVKGTDALGINDAGQVVGASNDANFNSHPLYIHRDQLVFHTGPSVVRSAVSPSLRL